MTPDEMLEAFEEGERIRRRVEAVKTAFLFGPAKVTIAGRMFAVVNLQIDFGRGEFPVWPYQEDAYCPVYRGRFVDDEMLTAIVRAPGEEIE